VNTTPSALTFGSQVTGTTSAAQTVSVNNPTNAAASVSSIATSGAFAQTNTGHDSRKEPSGTFVLNNPQKAIDYAWRAVHLTALTTKEITTAYYGKPISKSYWNSCSNGGRQGLVEAQRFPEDFDGIIANSPWVNQTGFTIGAMWNQKALSEASVSPAKLALVADKVMAKCDAIDGLKDALARLRKFGGRCVLGFQSLAQVSATYGSEAQTLIENCGNTVILRCSASEQGGTSQFAARLIGEREVIRRQIARAREGAGFGTARRSLTVSEQHVLEPAVLAAQIEQLPDLTGYLKTAGAREWLRVRVPREP